MMKRKVIRVQISRGDKLYFAESSDLPSLKLAHAERTQLIADVLAVIKYVHEQEGKQVVVHQESDDATTTTWVVTEPLRQTCE